MSTTLAPPLPSYRDRLVARYAAAAEERIDKARAAAAELGHTGPVPWDDIRAVYTRPTHTTWTSCRLILGRAFSAALVSLIMVWFGVMMTLSMDAKETTGARTEQTERLSAKAEAAEQKAAATRMKLAGKYAVAVFVVVFAVSACRQVSDKRKALHKGYAEDGDQVVTEALEVLPALAALSSASAGRARAEALTAVHEKVSELMSAVITSTGTAAGMQDKYVADRGRLREHGQKVRTAFTDKLGELVEDRERAARELGAMALTVAARQAQAAYGALLGADALPAEPGPEVLDVKKLRPVFTIAGAAALASLVLASVLGAGAAELLFIPLTVFALTAFLAAAYTRSLHQLGRVFAMFGRGGGDAGGGAL